MIFVAPWVLLRLCWLLPLLWWLLRVTPPPPRSEIFPAVRFLLGLNATEETPARTPWWLLALRLLAAGLVIVALARPVLDAGTALAGKGPVLLVMDNGWAAADDWVRRKEAAGALLDRAERAGRKAALLTTAPEGSGAPIAVSATMPVADLRARLAAMQPQPWPSDRAAAADAMRAWHDNSGRLGDLRAGRPDRWRRFRPLRRRHARHRPGDRNLLRHRAPRRCCCRRPARRTGWSPIWRRRPRADGHQRQRAGAKRRRPHPGAHQHHRRGRRLDRLRPDRRCRRNCATG